MALLALTSLVLFFALILLLHFSRRFARRHLVKPRAVPTPPLHCSCGYPLAKLEVPRCPECGRIIGFNATAEDLGLSYEQLQRIQQARQRRRAAQPQTD